MTEANDLHPTDRALLRALKETPWTPSYRELQETCGIASLHTVHRRLRQLEKDGLVAFSPSGKPRPYLTRQGREKAL